MSFIFNWLQEFFNKLILFFLVLWFLHINLIVFFLFISALWFLGFLWFLGIIWFWSVDNSRFLKVWKFVQNKLQLNLFHLASTSNWSSKCTIRIVENFLFNMIVLSLVEPITTNLESFFIRRSVHEWSLIKFIIVIELTLKFTLYGKLVWSYSRISKTSNSTRHDFAEFWLEISYFIVSKFLHLMGCVWIEWTHWCIECFKFL